MELYPDLREFNYTKGTGGVMPAPEVVVADAVSASADLDTACDGFMGAVHAPQVHKYNEGVIVDSDMDILFASRVLEIAGKNVHHQLHAARRYAKKWLPQLQEQALDEMLASQQD